MISTVRLVPGRDALRIADGLVRTYADVFAESPWNEGPEHAEDFRRRLVGDTSMAGFRVAVAGDDTYPDGFATAWPTTLPLPPLRAYARIARHLGPDRLRELLRGAVEVDELAVRPQLRGRGLGRQLLDQVTAGARRAWLVTSPEAEKTIDFYRRCGWTEVPPADGVGGEVVVFVRQVQ